MSDDDRSYALGRLVLDFIRAFLWPAVALVVVLVYQDDVRTILQEREVDIFGLRIGERVEAIESQALAEIADIRTLLEQRQRRSGEAGDAELIEDIETKLSSFERNLSREVSAVQSVETSPAQPSRPQRDPSAGRADRAAAAERRGFQALLERDYETALRAFDQAREIWPEYHNVAEIGRLLRDWQDRLEGSNGSAWPRLYREILTKYSWGLPEDLRPALREGAAQAYR